MVNCLIIIGSMCCVLCVPGFKEWKVDGPAVTRPLGERWSMVKCLDVSGSMCCSLFVSGFKEWKVDGAAVMRLLGELGLAHA
jgi:hypothetical protein